MAMPSCLPGCHGHKNTIYLHETEPVPPNITPHTFYFIIQQIEPFDSLFISHENTKGILEVITPVVEKVALINRLPTSQEVVKYFMRLKQGVIFFNTLYNC